MNTEHRLNITPLTGQENLSIEGNLPMFNSADQLHAAQAHINNRMNISLSDQPADVEAKYTGYDMQLYAAKRQNGQTIIRLSYKGTAIADMTPEFAAKYFKDMVFKRSLESLAGDIQANFVKRPTGQIELVIKTTERELTNHQVGIVKEQLQETFGIYKKLQRRINMHKNPLRTPGIKETKDERKEFRKIHQILQGVKSKLKRIRSRLNNMDTTVVNQAKVLEQAHQETQYYKNHMSLALDNALNGIAPMNLYDIDFMHDFEPGQHLHTPKDVRKYVRRQRAQDKLSNERTVERAQDNREGALAYNKHVVDGLIPSAVRIDPITQRPFIMEYNKNNGGTTNQSSNTQRTQCTKKYIDSNGKGLATDGSVGENFRNNLSTKGILTAGPQALVDIAEDTFGHDLTKGQKNLVRVAGLAGGVFLARKAVQATRNGIGKAIGSDKRYHIIGAGAALEVVSTITLGKGVFAGAIDIFAGGNNERLKKLADDVGITTPIENEQGQANQVATINQAIGDMTMGQINPYVSVVNGKYVFDNDGFLAAYPERAEVFRPIQNSNNPDIFHNYFQRIGVNPTQNVSPSQTLQGASYERLKQDAKDITPQLAKRGLQVADPEYANLQRLINDYDKDKTREQNITHRKKQGRIDQEVFAIDNQKELNKIKKLLSGITVSQLLPLHDAEGRDLDAMKNLVGTEKMNAFVNSHMGASGAQAALTDILEQIDIQNAPASRTVDSLVIEHIAKEKRKRHRENYLKTNGLELDAAHAQAKQTFLDNNRLLTDENITNRLEELEEQGIFEFNVQRIGYLEDFNYTTSRFESILQGQGFDFLSQRQKKILAALCTKLESKYKPPFSITPHAVNGGKLELKIHGEDDTDHPRQDRDGNDLGDSTSSLILDPTHFSIQGLKNEAGAHISFQDDTRPDKGLASMVLRSMQFAMVKHTFEGKSAIPGSADGEEGPFESERFGNGMQFREAKFWQEFMENVFELDRYDVVPGVGDAISTLTEYNSSLIASGMADQRYNHINIMEDSQGREATRRFYNKQNIWQSQHERQETQDYERKRRIISEEGIRPSVTNKLSDAGEATKKAAVSLYTTIKDEYTPEVVKDMLEATGNMISDLYDAGEEIVPTLLYSVGDLVKTFVDFNVETLRIISQGLKDGDRETVVVGAGRVVLVALVPGIIKLAVGGPATLATLWRTISANKRVAVAIGGTTLLLKGGAIYDRFRSDGDLTTEQKEEKIRKLAEIISKPETYIAHQVPGISSTGLTRIKNEVIKKQAENDQDIELTLPHEDQQHEEKIKKLLQDAFINGDITIEYEEEADE